MAFWDVDHSANPGLRLEDLERFLYEIRLQPLWRREADQDADYYDGNQLDNETLDAMQELGMAPLISNLIKPTIDVVLGMEAKTRADWRVDADSDEDEDVAEALSMKLAEQARAAKADRAISDAYAGQVKVGVQFVGVSRETDPFRSCKYRVESVHRRECFWDWRAQQPDLSDARYFVRTRWLDLDVVKLMFPGNEELIDSLGWSRANWDQFIRPTDMFARTYQIERDTAIQESNWRDTTRRRVAVYEVWYREYVRGFVFRLPNGRVVEVDVKNPRHQQALAVGAIEPIEAVYPKVRLSWWVGPHRLADVPTPYKHRHFPYVPFWGFREDLTGIPYGLIRTMRSPQDEVNARKSKMMYLLSARMIIADEDQVDDWDEVRSEASRPDAMLLLSRRRDKNGKFEVKTDFQLAQQQFQVMEAAVKMIQDSAGVYQEMLGKAGAAQSGIAINSLVEQGTTTLAEINDNYRYGRRMVGELLLDLVREDMANTPMGVKIGDGPSKRTVSLNVPVTDDFGSDYLDNDVTRVLVKVGLEDVPTTPAYRAQMFQQLTEMTKAMPPQVQAFIIPFILEASEMPHRREVAQQVRKAMGMGTGEDGQQQGPTFEQQAQMQQAVQQQVAQILQQHGIEKEQAEMEARRLDLQIKGFAAAQAAKVAAKDSETRRMAVELTANQNMTDSILKHSLNEPA